MYVQVEEVTQEAAALGREVKSMRTRLELQEGHHHDQLQQINDNHAGGGTWCAEGCSQCGAGCCATMSTRQDDLAES